MKIFGIWILGVAIICVGNLLWDLVRMQISLWWGNAKITIKLKDGSQNVISYFFYDHGLYCNLLSIGQRSKRDTTCIFILTIVRWLTDVRSKFCPDKFFKKRQQTKKNKKKKTEEKRNKKRKERKHKKESKKEREKKGKKKKTEKEKKKGKERTIKRKKGKEKIRKKTKKGKEEH